MKVSRKILSCALALSMAASAFAAPAFAEEELSYDEVSTQIYDAALGEFYEYYLKAEECESVSERFAVMAIAEAKMLESGVMVPLETAGGSYQVTRVAPYTVDHVLWGSDYERRHQALVCTEPILAEYVEEMRAKWNELRGTGTYEAWAKEYLAEKGYTLKDTYNMTYNADPETWDCLSASTATVCDALVNTYDGLLEYDPEGILKPALAESYEVSEDGLTYTFHLREGVEWVDSQGRKIADVVADDFVAGMQHMMDAQGGLEYLVQGIIKNASEYISGEITDFAEVGVEAADDHTLVYTLESPCSYFDTMMGYSVFAPMCRSFYESKGGKFGAEFDSGAADYTYGKDSNSIAYCGPYLVTNATEKNTIVYQANDTYWNKDNINIHTITWLYNDMSDPTKSYTDFKADTLDVCALNSTTLEVAKGDGTFDQYAYVSDNDACTYVAYYNLNRAIWANFNDDTTVVSPQTEEDKARTNAAMNNQHFRLALCYGLDRANYNGQRAGEELKYVSLRNSYTPATFVSLAEETTVDINGTATTFPAGTWYGEIMQAQLDADGCPITVYDPETGSGDGFDGWYNPENAAAELELAIAELAEEGIVIDESNPIYLDLPFNSTNEVYTNKSNVYKQSVENSLGGKVILNLVSCADSKQWYYAGYYSSYGYECNFDIYDFTGWIPDFGDPSSYLGTMLPDYAGYQVKNLGIF